MKKFYFCSKLLRGGTIRHKIDYSYEKNIGISSAEMYVLSRKKPARGGGLCFCVKNTRRGGRILIKRILLQPNKNDSKMSNKKHKKSTVLVTGATSGIGEAVAESLASKGFDLIITGRREKRLETLAWRLQAEFGVEILPLAFDISDAEATKNAIENLPEKWQKIDILVNNAGLAVGLDDIQSGEIDDWEQMIDTNIKGLLYISRAVMPQMMARKSGHIVNISSIAGKEVYPKGNVYCATKHAVEALTKGMRQDLLPYNVRVSSIAPGMVETEFSLVRFKGNQEAADKVYQKITPLSAADIAEVLVFIIERPPHVNINDLTIMPTAQANSTLKFLSE